MFEQKIGPIFMMLVGLPASGKSTVREVFLRDTPHKFVVLSTDDIIECVAAGMGKTYDEAFSLVIKDAEKEFFDQFKVATDSRANILMDRTNLSHKKRKGILSQLPSEYRKIAVVVTKPDDVEWKRRLDSRTGKKIPAHVLESMQQNMTYPTVDEGWGTISVIRA